MSGEEPQLNIEVFEYKLQNYGDNGADSKNPNVYTTELHKTTDPAICDVIEYTGGTAPDDGVHSCDVLKGILSKDKSEDTTLTTNVMDPMKEYDISFGAFSLSDLLWITTQHPTKSQFRPDQLTFETSLGSRKIKSIYTPTYITSLKDRLLTDLAADWNEMQLNAQTKALGLKRETIKENYDKTILETFQHALDESSSKSSTPSLKEMIVAKRRIEGYTMVQALAPEEDEQFIIIGDLHGSLATFVRLLYRWRIAGYIDANGYVKENLNIVCLGDISDRGVWGYEIYCTLFELYKKNRFGKGHLYITRGNHEEFSMNSKDGFLDHMNTIFLPVKTDKLKASIAIHPFT
jgi:hypothetical protein